MFYISSFRQGNKVGVIDSKDGVVEYYTPSEIAKFPSMNITIITPDVMSDFLSFMNHLCLEEEKFSGDDFNTTLKYVVDKVTGQFSDSICDLKKEYKKVKRYGFDADITRMLYKDDLLLFEYVRFYSDYNHTSSSNKKNVLVHFCKVWGFSKEQVERSTIVDNNNWTLIENYGSVLDVVNFDTGKVERINAKDLKRFLKKNNVNGITKQGDNLVFNSLLDSHPNFKVLCFLNSLIVNMGDLDNYTLENFINSMKTSKSYRSSEIGGSRVDYLSDLVSAYNNVRGIFPPDELYAVYSNKPSRFTQAFNSMLSASRRRNSNDLVYLDVLHSVNLPDSLLPVAKDKLFVMG